MGSVAVSLGGDINLVFKQYIEPDLTCLARGYVPLHVLFYPMRISIFLAPLRYLSCSTSTSLCKRRSTSWPPSLLVKNI
jgi:hypothetical protein